MRQPNEESNTKAYSVCFGGQSDANMGLAKLAQAGKRELMLPEGQSCCIASIAGLAMLWLHRASSFFSLIFTGMAGGAISLQQMLWDYKMKASLNYRYLQLLHSWCH